MLEHIKEGDKVLCVQADILKHIDARFEVGKLYNVCCVRFAPSGKIMVSLQSPCGNVLTYKEKDFTYELHHEDPQCYYKFAMPENFNQEELFEFMLRGGNDE